MSKVTKKERIKELERQVRGLTVLFSSLNTWSEYADSMLKELNHTLPDLEYDAKCEAQEADVDASLDRHRERLGLNKPKVIERDLAKEPIGSDLVRAMLARGDKYVLCHLSQTSEKSAKDVLGIAIGHDHSGFRVQRHNSWQYAIPINNQGEPLTAADVGL